MSDSADRLSSRPNDHDRLFTLGDDAAVEVLLRLPPDALFRSKCVSKKWCSVISDSSFADRYHRRSESAYDCNGFLCQLLPPSCPVLGLEAEEAHFVPYYKNQYSFASTVVGRLNSMTLSRRSFLVTDSHNGFFLCCRKSTCPEHFYICNPLTREWVSLPHPPKSVFDMFVSKLVCLQDNRFRVLGLYCKAGSSFVEIQTFSSESGEWKATIVAVTHWGSPGLCCPTPLGETLYWVDRYGRLAAFNTREEELCVLSLPDEVFRDGNLQLGRLWVSSGRLHYIHCQIGFVCVWELLGEGRQKEARGESPWILKHKRSLSDMVLSHPETFDTLQEYEFASFRPELLHHLFIPLALHHTNPNIVFFKISRLIVRFDLDDSSFEVVYRDDVSLLDHMARSCVLQYVMPVSPGRIPCVRKGPCFSS